MYRKKKIFVLFILLLTHLVYSQQIDRKDFVCPKEPYPFKENSISDVYLNQPFGEGEKAVYKLTYMGMLAGYGTMEVRAPRKLTLSEQIDGKTVRAWHRVFHADAKTGDWFKYVFVGHDEIETISRPWDFGVSKFYMQQDEGTLLGKRFQQEKWLEFNHQDCRVKERTVKPLDKSEKKGEFDFMRLGLDVFGVAYKLRTHEYKIGEKVRELVYTSEKNWWLEAHPIAYETIEVPPGKFEAVKIKLQTYIGQELQQKGDVYIWFDRKTPYKPLLMVQAEIKIGSVWLTLNDWTPKSK